MTSGLMFGVFWKEDYLKDRGGPSLGRWVNSGIEDSLPGGVHSIPNTVTFLHWYDSPEGARVGNAQ
jgi:hypothetical protein